MDLIKKLTGKNQSDYEQAAAHIIDCADVEVFKNLIKKDDFLFDFVKKNVAKRLERACNKDNFKNLLKFLKFYSPSYDEFIAKVFFNNIDDEVIRTFRSLLYEGVIDEQCYAAKFYSLYKDESVVNRLRELAFNDNEALAINSTLALALLNDKVAVDMALQKIKSNDDFDILSGVKFLSVFGEKSLLSNIFDVMKKSSVSEYIACEIGYMESFLNLLNSEYYDNTLLAIMNILQGLGEIVPMSNVFSFQLFEVFEYLINTAPNSKSIIVLLSAKNKFEQLTENDEYLYDEDKNTKDEVYAIKELLNKNLDDDLTNLIYVEMNENSDFVYYALDLANNVNCVKNLLTSTNQTLLLKTVETLKYLGHLTQEDKSLAISNISDENIKTIINAL